MTPLPFHATDADLLAFVDHWVMLLEGEAYEAAFAHTEHLPERGWTPALIRSAVKGYGAARANQIVTLHGESTDIMQRKQVSRHEPNDGGFIGTIWYDLHIDGQVSDLTATFGLQAASRWDSGVPRRHPRHVTNRRKHVGSSAPAT